MYILTYRLVRRFSTYKIHLENLRCTPAPRDSKDIHLLPKEDREWQDPDPRSLRGDEHMQLNAERQNENAEPCPLGIFVTPCGAHQKLIGLECNQHTF